LAVQAERLLSDIAELTGQGSRVTVNVQQNAMDPQTLWESGGAEAWANRNTPRMIVESDE